MSKKEFIEELKEIVEDPLFIRKTIKDLQYETAENTWSVSMNQELANEFTVEELVSFFSQVKSNRKEQIVENSEHPMIFYAWFDWQSASLKFSLISAFHGTLPFSASHKMIPNIEPILAEFLRFPYHDGFSYK